MHALRRVVARRTLHLRAVVHRPTQAPRTTRARGPRVADTGHDDRQRSRGLRRRAGARHGGRGRQAARQHLPAGQALRRVAQDQDVARTGVRRRRMARRFRSTPGTPRLFAGRPLRGREAPTTQAASVPVSTRRRAPCSRSSVAGLARDTSPFDVGSEAAASELGRTRDSSSTCASRTGPGRGSCARRATAGCATTRIPPRWCARSGRGRDAEGGCPRQSPGGRSRRRDRVSCRSSPSRATNACCPAW